MISKTLKIVIQSNGDYLDVSLPNIVANEKGRSVIQVIAPFPTTDIVSVNYSVRPIQADIPSQYLLPTGLFGKDVFAEDYTYFQTVAYWNVFEIPISSKALEYISKYRAGMVLASFTIAQQQVPYLAAEYKGTFDLENPIPTTNHNDGDYYVVNDYNFIWYGITWTKGDYAYYRNGEWIKGKNRLVAQASSIELPVDPSIKGQPTIDYDEDVALLLAQDLGLLTQRVSQAETDIESAENDINEIDGRVGINETDIYNLESDVGNLQSDKADKTELVPIISELERLENEKVDLSLYTYDKGLQNTRDNAQENRLDTVEIDVANLENQNLLHSPTFNGTNGHLTFQRYGASPIVIDLPTEMIVTSGVYDDINNELVLNLASGGEVRIPVGNLLTDLDAENIRYNGAGTYYLSGKNRVEQAINELDLQVKAVNDNKLDASVYNNDIPLIDAELLRLEDDKANKSTTYTKTEVDNEVAKKVNLLIDQPLSFFSGLSLREWFTANQLVTNGDFSVDSNSDGLADNWVNYAFTPTFSILNGQRIQYTNNSGDIEFNGIEANNYIPIANGNKIYVTIKAKKAETDTNINVSIYGLRYYNGALALGNLFIIPESLTTSYRIYSDIITLNNASVNQYKPLILRQVNNMQVSDFTIDDFMQFNISTLIANKQYSPLYNTTFDLMTDSQIKQQLDYWVALYNFLKSNNEFEYTETKANKQLEAWITPTITSATSTYLRYRKDNFDTVIIEGNITVGTAETNFTLPTGYRPLTTLVLGDFTFNTNGTVVSATTGLKYINVRFTGGA